MGETLFSIRRLLDPIAAWISEASVEPAADHEVSEHVDLITAELGLATRLILGASRLALLVRSRRVRHRFRLDHQDFHHGAECVGHQVSADDEAFENLVHNMLAKISQVLARAVEGSRVRSVTTAEDLPVHLEEFSLVK